MTANEEFVKDTFVRFNAELFRSELPMPRIRLSRASSFLGKLQYKVHRRGFGRKPTYSDYALIFSTLYDLPQSEWEDVVIHEMIHYMLMLHDLPRSFQRHSRWGKSTGMSPGIHTSADIRTCVPSKCISCPAQKSLQAAQYPLALSGGLSAIRKPQQRQAQSQG